MDSMNIMVLLLLSIGYMITEKYDENIRKYIFLSLVYFALLCSKLYFDDDNYKYEIAVYISTIAIILLISFIFIFSYLVFIFLKHINLC